MATTTNFGWDTPDDGDYVTDGAAAMRELGQDIDTTLVDLKGGTTGQMLTKASNTDMDFTWASPNPGDITAVTAGTGISGGGTSGDVTITNSMATAIDAKGDLIAGTGADAFSRLAVGNNGETLVADSSTATGLKWAKAANWHGARVYKSTTQSISNNTQTTMSFDAEYYDTDGYHDNSTNNSRLTVPTGFGGMYMVRGRINFTSNATGVRYAIIGKNGQTSAQYDSYTVYNAVNGAETMFDVTTIVNLAANDYVELFGIQTSGSTININGGAIYYTDFSLNLIGV